MKLKFINHASYIVESSYSLLLHDPWLEGNAFNNGWSLLSKEISNEDIINYLNSSKKAINIWISHEHSDHFSISFIKALKAAKIRCKFFFQKTADKRVLSYLLSNNFKVIECKNGKEYRIDNDLFLSVYPFSGGDSFCFLRTNTKNILNINDCVIKTNRDAKRVLSRLPKGVSIDILFTQFGYANWIGRKEDYLLRKESANEKFIRILIQENNFNPDIIIPFASFIYFCKEDNFYMNDQQNFPNILRSDISLKHIQEKINFMKPNQEVILGENTLADLQRDTVDAESYWDSFESDIKQSNNKSMIQVSNSVSADDLVKLGKSFISKVRYQTLGIVSIFELARILGLKPISFHVYDLDISFNLSYVKGISHVNSKYALISLHSSELAFILKNEFGWNTLCVSGAFRAQKSDIFDLNAFFRWQDAIKNGFSAKHPLYTLRVVTNFILRRLYLN